MIRSILEIASISALVTYSIACVNSHCWSGENEAVLIRATEQGQISVESIETSELSDRKDQGLLIWSEGGKDRWSRYDGTSLQHGNQQFDNVLASASRGDVHAVEDGSLYQTASIDQLLGIANVRAGSDFLTPIQGIHVQPKITFRRRPLDGKGTDFPAAEAVVERDRQELLRISFPENVQTLRWSQISVLPEKLKQGLAPGRYTIRLIGGSGSTTFTVLEAEDRQRLLEPVRDLRKLLDDSQEALYRQFHFEQLVLHNALADALDVLEQVPERELTKYLRNAGKSLFDKLAGKEQTPSTGDEGTSVDAIDAAKEMITASRWDEARRILAGIPSDAPPRVQALAILYDAVILAESGRAQAATTDQLFEAASRALQKSTSPQAADLFRVYNNYGNHRLNRAQDQLYNHAFQMATGVQDPLMSVMRDWLEASDAYQKALGYTTELEPLEEAAVQVSLARLYAFLADVVRVLDVPTDGKRMFESAEKSAAQQAKNHAKAALSQSTVELDPLTKSVAHELLAHLAYRQRNSADCLKQAKLAQQNYLDAGSLAGIESIHRLLGLLNLRGSEFGLNENGEVEALRRLQISNLLAEFLRERIPVDQVGLSRAGFFARRAYVNEQIIYLLVSQRKFAEALKFAESAKARALQDLLQTRGIPEASEDRSSRHDLTELLGNWPKSVVAVEYFIGNEHAWVFVVDHSGNVTAHELVDNEAKPVDPRELIAEVHRLLDHMNQQKVKMRQRYRFDHAWQAPLHRLCKILVPQAALEKMREAETVVLVPHHILHYLPFAALVIEPDSKEKWGRFEVPIAKRFLIDESFAISYAPSLAIWQHLRENSRPIRSVNAIGIVEFDFGEPLQGVKDDMRNLQETFGNRVKKVLDDQQATEPNIISVLARPGMLFVATHGMNIADQPLASHLLCRPDQDGDGRVMAVEVFHGNVGADLIVLSACYSGLADRSPLPGDDLFGLERAFLQSGATSVVSGLWDVCDKAGPEVMSRFMKHFADGLTVPQALARAQRDFLRDAREEGPNNVWNHPYFWAVYRSSGSDLTHFVRSEN